LLGSSGEVATEMDEFILVPDIKKSLVAIFYFYSTYGCDNLLSDV
jgi:hypothetical protein